VKRTEDFRVCPDIASLAKKIVELKRHIMFLIELTMLLPMATTTIENAFSIIKIVKAELHFKIFDGWLSNLMVCCIKLGIFIHLDLGKN
jgi:hypothetical protein